MNTVWEKHIFLVLVVIPCYITFWYHANQEFYCDPWTGTVGGRANVHSHRLSEHLQTAPVGRHHGGNRACRLPVWATQESRLTSLCVRHQLLIWIYSICFACPNFVIVNAVNGQTSKNGAAACHPPRILKGCSHHCNLHVAGADRDPASKLREVNKRRCRVSESILQFAMQNDKADMQRQKQEVHIGACMSMLRVHFHFVCVFRIPNKFHARVETGGSRWALGNAGKSGQVPEDHSWGDHPLPVLHRWSSRYKGRSNETQGYVKTENRCHRRASTI